MRSERTGWLSAQAAGNTSENHSPQKWTELSQFCDRPTPCAPTFDPAIDGALIHWTVSSAWH